eukprot:400171_1
MVHENEIKQLELDKEGIIREYDAKIKSIVDDNNGNGYIQQIKQLQKKINVQTVMNELPSSSSSESEGDEKDNINNLHENEIKQLELDKEGIIREYDAKIKSIVDDNNGYIQQIKQLQKKINVQTVMNELPSSSSSESEGDEKDNINNLDEDEKYSVDPKSIEFTALLNDD